MKYDWRACAIAIAAGLAVAAPAGLLVTRATGSTMLMTAAVTVVGTVVSKWVYPRVARPGARSIANE